MTTDSNYPLMSSLELERAPWNEDIPEEKEFDIICSQSLSKKVTVTTDTCDSEVDFDEYGPYTIYHTEDVEWDTVYEDNAHYTPIELIEMFKKLLQEHLEKGNVLLKSPKYTEHIIEECSDWSEDECEFIEE